MIDQTVLLESYNLGAKDYSEDLAGRFWAEALTRNFKNVVVLTRSKVAADMYPMAQVHCFEPWPKLPRFLEKIGLQRFRSYFNYVSWLYRSARIAKSVMRRLKVDLVVHGSWSSLFIGTRIRPRGPRLVMAGGGLDLVPEEFIPYMSPADKLRQRFLTVERGAKLLRGIDFIFYAGTPPATMLEASQVPYVRMTDLYECIEPRVRPQKPPDGACKVLLLAGASTRKGLQIALKAWRQAKLKASRLTVLGDVPGCRTGDGIEFRGRVGREEYFAELLASDALIFPSYREGTSTTLMEAVFHGVPVICFGRVGMNDMLDPSHNLILQPDGSDPALVLSRGLETFESRRIARGESPAFPNYRSWFDFEARESLVVSELRKLKPAS